MTDVSMCVSAEMMESCLAGKPERVGPVEVDDIRRDLLGEFAALPVQVGLPVCAVMVSAGSRQYTDSCCFSHQDSDQEQSENLQVYLRVRPFTAAESNHGGSQVTHTHTCTYPVGCILR